jgi:hypothetical protein
VRTDDGRLEVFGRHDSRGWLTLGTLATAGTGGGPASLVAARVSGLPLEEVVALDASGRSVLACLGEVSAASDSGDLGEPLVSAFEDEPVAALSLRLNADAQHDLVVLFRHDPRPHVLPSAFEATFTVTNAHDAGGGSLRSAINSANATPGSDLIQFSIGVGGTPTISVTSPLPAIVDAVTIDGYTQYEAVPNTAPLAAGTNAVLKVVLNGYLAGAGGVGLDLAAGGSTVRGLVFQNFDDDGIRVRSNGNRIEGNFMGVGVGGTTALPNENGIRIDGGADNVVGGTAPEARNLISGNYDDGIELTNVGATGNSIVGNLIGTTRNGAGAASNASDGLEIAYATDNTVGGTDPGAGNVISANGYPSGGDGIDIRSSAGTLVQGNLIGVTADGTGTLGNNGEGVQVESPEVTVGGSVPGAANVIAASWSSGVLIRTVEATLNLVQGNLIGTDPGGELDMGNGYSGVWIQSSPGNTVGGVVSGVGNVISGNANSGITLQNPDTTGNQIQGNLVGTDAAGSSPLPNDGEGIRMLDVPGNLIGGSSGSGGNLISANTSAGVWLYGGTATTNQIVGNRIGTDLAGEPVLGNASAGVQLTLAVNNDVGGPSAGDGNVIAGNGEEGVVVDPLAPAATGNRILGNSIFANALLGIDLGADGVTPNDPGDSDAGPNNLQNFPVIDSALLDDANNVTIAGTLDSATAAVYRLEFFSGISCDATGHGEGAHYLGSTVVTTDGGSAGFDVTLPNPVVDANTITATATSTGRDTSEFSACSTAECAGIGSVFPHTLLAVDRDTLSWGTPTDVRWAKGLLFNVYRYWTTGRGLLLNASTLDISFDQPGPGVALYYVVRGAVCGSWQTTPGAEPGRDDSLP